MNFIDITEVVVVDMVGKEEQEVGRCVVGQVEGEVSHDVL